MIYCSYNRIQGYSQVPERLRTNAARTRGRIGNGVRISDRTAAVRQSRGHIPLIFGLRRGRGKEAESEDLPVERYIEFFGLRNDMSQRTVQGQRSACLRVFASRRFIIDAGNFRTCLNGDSGVSLFFWRESENMKTVIFESSRGDRAGVKKP